MCRLICYAVSSRDEPNGEGIPPLLVSARARIVRPTTSIAVPSFPRLFPVGFFIWIAYTA